MFKSIVIGLFSLTALAGTVRFVDIGVGEFTQTTTPSNPASLKNRIYFKSDNKLYKLTSAGLETEVGAGSGDVVGPASSVDSELALFDGITGKLLKRASGSGYGKLSSGVLSVQSTPLPSADLNGGRTVNAQTGTTYTFALSDGSAAGGFPLVTASNASAQTYTVPPNSSVAFPVGTQIDVTQLGAGLVTFAQGAGVTINSANGLAMSGQYAAASLIKTATDTWSLVQGSTASSSGSSSLRIFNVAFGGATEGTNACTSNPCTIYRQYDDAGNTDTVSSVGRDATGRYTINITSGRCSSPPMCSGVPTSNVGGNTVSSSNTVANNPTNTAFYLRGNDNTGSSAEIGAYVNCTCKK